MPGAPRLSIIESAHWNRRRRAWKYKRPIEMYGNGDLSHNGFCDRKGNAIEAIYIFK